jgi:eukaryotic-like serine/threonine-protein kinase
MADETGQRVGDYEVLAKLGTGGMGRVYKVRNVISNREEAMKVLLPDFAADPELAARFMAEIRTLATLDHPGIAQLRTAFEYQNQFVMVMELVEGTTLEKLASQIRIPLDHVLDYAGQVLAGLSYAHGRGVTHRDIKPANIMITTHGLVKLMDFGIAKSTGELSLTRPGTTMGSVYYMSPEQVQGGTVDARSDIYSFGITLYEVLAGRKPFQADTSYTVLNAQINQTPTPLIELNPSIPRALNDIVLRAMAKLPVERFQAADEFRNALKAVQEAAIPPVAATAPQPAATPTPSAYFPALSPAGPAYAPVPPPAVPPPPATRSRRGLWIGVGAAAALLALIAVGAVLPRVFSTHASQQAVQSQSPTPTPSPAPSSAPAPADSPQQSAPQAQASISSAPDSGGSVSTPSDLTHSPGDSRTTKPRPAPGAGTKHAPDASAQSDSQASPAAAEPANTPPAGRSPQEIRQAHDRLMNLDARAQSAEAGVQQIRSQQQAQGLDIRGDILAAMNRMHNDMNEADGAMARNDLEAAKDYMERADHEIATLEKFLGR